MNDKENIAAASGQSWDAEAYAATGRFVSQYGSAVVKLLAPLPGEKILDLGCGDGALTEEIAATGALVTGVDSSATMLAAAAARGLNVQQSSGDALSYQQQFDAVFSNAALHWMPNADAVIAGVHRALRPGGRFVAEMGGLGNIAAIRVALQSVLAQRGVDAEAAAASLFPSATHYRSLLQRHGFTVEYIEMIPRPTPLPAGMEAWLNTFRNGVLDRLPPAERTAALQQTIALLKPVLCDVNGNWTADYVRLRFKAIRS
jgi:trans-aconitate methyltransferase